MTSRRREVIRLLGGAAAWPLAVRAQQGERMRRIGVLVSSAKDDVSTTALLAEFRQRLERLGWVEGRNIRIDYAHRAAGRGQGAGDTPAGDSKRIPTHTVVMRDKSCTRQRFSNDTMHTSILSVSPLWKRECVSAVSITPQLKRSRRWHSRAPAVPVSCMPGTHTIPMHRDGRTRPRGHFISSLASPEPLTEREKRAPGPHPGALDLCARQYGADLD
jgi:hypothetical protein